MASLPDPRESARDADLRVLGRLLVEDRAAAPADWEGLVRLAIDERVGGILLDRVAERDDVPGAALDRLRAELYRSTAHNLLLYRELARILNGHRQSFVDVDSSPPVLLKGAALAASVYRDVGLRPMSDLDLLVPDAQVESWLSLLGELGYRPFSPEMSPGLNRITHYHLALRGGAEHQVIVELHWSLVAGEADWRAPDMEWFWQRTRSWSGVPESGCPPARELTPEALVLYLSVHAVLQHGGAQARLVWLYDLHRVVSDRGGDIDWTEVTERARAFRWSVPVRFALERIHFLFGTEITEGVFETLGRDHDHEAAVHVARKDDPTTSRAGMVLREMKCLNRRGRLRLAAAILFPRPGYLRWRYPRARRWWPLCYPYRWGVVLWEAIAAMRRSDRRHRAPSSC